MRGSSPIHRFSALWCLVLHLGLVVAGPVLDARLEAEAYSAEKLVLHVEETGTPDCPPNHHHQLCLVRALESMNAGVDIAPVRFSPEPSFPPHPPSAVTTPASACTTALGPRAPPIT
jgi:hypothetical protein